MRAETAIEINAPASLVFSLISPARLGEWFGLQEGAKWRLIDDKIWGKGAGFEVSCSEDKTLNYRAAVTEFSAPATLTWRTTSGPTSTIIFILVPVELTTSIQMIEAFEAGLLEKLRGAKARAARNAAFMENLKKLAEWEAYQMRKQGRADAPAGPVSPIKLFEQKPE